MLIFDGAYLEWKNSGLGAGTVRFEFEDRRFRSPELSWTRSGGDDWKTRLPNGLVLEMTVAEERLSMRFRNGETPLFLKEIGIDFAPGPEAEDYLEYTHSRLFLEQVSGVKPVGVATPLFAANPPSYLVYQLIPRRPGNSALLLASLPPNRGEYAVFRAVHASPAMRGKFGVGITAEEDRSIAPQAEFALSELLFRISDRDPAVQLEELGDLYAEHRTRKLKPVRTGWNSWDELHTAVKPEDVYRAQEELQTFSGGRVRTFAVDDGWQIAYGAWTPNPKFQDLGAFCRNVTAAGGIPGIWTAPLLADNSYLLPVEWSFPDPAQSGRRVLDITLPEVQEYVRSLYAGLRRTGFRYFKVDFTNSILNAKKLHDMSMGRAGVLRLLYRTIREAIGEDGYFLGCCVPYEPAFDLVDAVRTTADIQICWSCVLINMAGASARWWMHRKLWNNDPDFLVVRGPETAGLDDTMETPLEAGKYNSGPRLSRREAATLALALHMTGGDLMLSDVFGRLNETGKRILHDVLELEPLKKAARPADLYTCECGELPAYWWDAESGKLAVFNWSENIRRMEIVPGRFGAARVGSAFWNPTQTESREGGGVTIVLAPHEATGIVLNS